MSKINETEFLKKLEAVFYLRKKCNIRKKAEFCSDFEMSCIEELFNYDWKSVDVCTIENVSLSFLSSEGFKYFLKAIIRLSIQEKNPYLLSVDKVISDLDRPPNRSNWDDGFCEKWIGFTVEEYQLIQEWLYIINQMGNDEDIDSIFRCIDTIELLAMESQRTSVG